MVEIEAPEEVGWREGGDVQRVRWKSWRLGGGAIGNVLECDYRGQCLM